MSAPTGAQNWTKRVDQVGIDAGPRGGVVGPQDGERGDAAGGGGRGQPLEPLVAGGVGVVLDVEPGQAQDGAGEVEGRDDGDRLGDEEVVAPLLAQAQQEEGRGGAEADGVAQAVELAAELAGGPRQPGGVAVEYVEEHGDEDQGRAEHEVVVDVVCAHRAVEADLAGVGDGGEAAHAVAEGQQRRQDGNPFHGGLGSRRYSIRVEEIRLRYRVRRKIAREKASHRKIRREFTRRAGQRVG